MTNTVLKGTSGQTLSPLRPSGKVLLNGITYEARSEGHWIDSETEIIVIGSRAGNVIVRQREAHESADACNGEALAIGEATITTPLHAPPSKVERLNSVLWGTVIGCLAVPITLMTGQVLSLAVILLPLAGACAGWIFRTFIRQAINSVAPREDHRPRTYVIATLLFIGAAVGSYLGAFAGLGVAGICLGLILGTLAGGVTSWMAILLLMML